MNKYYNKRTFRYTNWREAQQICDKAGVPISEWKADCLRFVETTRSTRMDRIKLFAIIIIAGTLLYISCSGCIDYVLDFEGNTISVPCTDTEAFTDSIEALRNQ